MARIGAQCAQSCSIYDYDLDTDSSPVSRPSLLAQTPRAMATQNQQPGRQIDSQKRNNSTDAKRFSYHLAASFIGKDRPYDPSHHVFHFNPYHHQIQSPSYKRSQRTDSGHDAFFVNRVNDSNAVAFGLADGVGGWVDSGVDPADFSHTFCGNMATAARENKTHDSRRLTSRQLMQQGYEAVCRDRSIKAGGSTACVGIAHPDGTLDVANLGDSGFLQLRLNAIHSYSEPQTHAFNTPYQLSLVPPHVAARMATYGGQQLSDLPRDADQSLHDMRHGDVIIFATDGVFDNVFNQDILRIASRVMTTSGAWEKTDNDGLRASDALKDFTDPVADQNGKPVTLQSMLATALVGAAKRASLNTRVDGPFAKEVQKYFPQENWKGGKVDDICVVVAVVVEEGNAPPKAKL